MDGVIELLLIAFLFFLFYHSRQYFGYPLNEKEKHLNSVLQSPHPNRMMDNESYLVPGFYTHGYYFEAEKDNKRWEDWTYGQKYAKISA